MLVVAAVIERDGLLLIGQRRREDRHPLKWEFPGGKVEDGETPPDALQRELREELAIEAEIGPEITRYEYQYPGRPPVLLIFYSVRAWTGAEQNLCFEQIRWVPKRGLTSYEFLEGDIDFVRRLATD
jgi:8-oxo-dGTP diphosphatase